MLETLPDIHPAIRTLLSGKTSAGTKVDPYLPPSPPDRYITYQRENAIPEPSWNRMEVARITVRTWARAATVREGESLAYKLALEVRGVMIPPENVTGGFFGLLGDVYISGVSLDTGPYPGPDAIPMPHWIQSFLIPYYGYPV